MSSTARGPESLGDSCLPVNTQEGQQTCKASQDGTRRSSPHVNRDTPQQVSRACRHHRTPATWKTGERAERKLKHSFVGWRQDGWGRLRNQVSISVGRLEGRTHRRKADMGTAVFLGTACGRGLGPVSIQCQSVRRQRNSDPYLRPQARVHTRRIIGLNVNAKTANFLEENMTSE